VLDGHDLIVTILAGTVAVVAFVVALWAGFDP
jgi:hypothetical protein